MRKVKYICPVLFLLSIISVSEITAQNNPYNEVTIASPTAASLGKYADIPVNYHTGIPQISIPIYTVKEGPLTLPISLSYHASGLKVMEPAGWVGAGWSLNAGGVITRTVQGAPDERLTSSVYDQMYGHLSDNGYNKYLWVTGPGVPPSYAPPSWAPQNEGQDWNYFSEGKKDGEPDLFFFNFGGYSGKFYFHDDGSAVLVPEQDVKVEYSYIPGMGKSIDNFTLTTSDGTKYYFGKTDNTSDTDPVEKTDPFTAAAGLSTGTVTSSWYLNKIVSADDLFNITLSYTAENYSYYTLSLFPIPGYEFTETGYKPVKNIVTGVRLNKITFSNGSVDFVPASSARLDLNGTMASFVDDANTQAKALASIRISNAGEVICKKFDFTYSYFEDNTSSVPQGLVSNVTTDKKRLKLNSVQESSCNGSVVIPPHQFEYFTELVPRRFSFAQDHWGFINNATGNTSLIPTLFPNSFEPIYGANRDANWPAMRGGALKKIIYPTGGYTEFEFEPNYTWVSYTRSSWISRFYLSAGYDGSSLPVSQYHSFTNNSYKIDFTNSVEGSQALLRIFNSSNVEVEGHVLESGQSLNTIVQFPAGTYRIEMQKLAPVSSHGAEVELYEWTPSNIAKNETVGGLRIKKMIVTDGIQPANNIITDYSYEIAGHSTGILYSKPAYVFTVRNDIWRDVGFTDGPTCSAQGCLTCDGSGMFYYKSPVSVRPMETTQGNHIGYNEVKVSKTGNGYSIYKYYGSNLWDMNITDVSVRDIPQTCTSTITNYPFAPLPHEFMRGELKYEAHFNEAGQPLKDVYYYPVYQDNPKVTPAFIATFMPPPQFVPPYSSYTPGSLPTFYTLSTAKKIETGVVEKIYSPGINSITTSSYTYFESPYHNQPTRTSTTSSTGETIETKIKYASDFRITTCDVISDCYSAYNTAKTSAWTTYGSRLGTCADHTCRWWAWQAYIKELSIARINFVTCRQTNYTGSTNSFKSCLVTAKNAADVQLKPILELQTTFNNPQIEVNNWNNSQLLSSSFIKYDFATNPAGKVYPSVTQQINLEAPSSGFTAANTSANNTSVTKDSRYTDETTIKVNAGNLSEITPKSGITATYLWDYNNNFPIAKTINALNSVTAFTSFEADGNGNWSVGSNSRITNDGITGKQSYQLSNGAVTKTGLTSGQSYIVSYWTKNASAFTISGTQGSAVQGKTISGWTYFEHAVTGVTQVNLSGTGLIDELRLYPSQAQMITYTYDPLRGMTSECDVNNRISYYEYDALNRLTLIRDQDKNVIKTIDYKYAGIVP